MHYLVRIRKEALIEIQEVVSWYESIKIGLGSIFKINISKYIDQLEIYPFMYGIRYDDIRCIPLKQFPYMVHYRIIENKKEVQILAVINTHRNPKIWCQKTKTETHTIVKK